MTESETQPSPARQRAEARKQKLLTQGNDRLAKITGAMKGHQPAPSSTQSSPPIPSTETPQDPPEIDISNLSTTSTPTLHSSDSNMKLNQPISTPSSHLGSLNPGNDSIVDDSMFEMMKSMGLQLPPGFDPSAFKNQTQFDPSNLSPNNQAMSSSHWTDSIFPILTITFILGLVYTNYSSQSTLQVPDHALGITNPNLNPTPIFWMFVTIELSLQATRWFFKRNTPQSSGMLRTLAGSLPSPYSNLISIGIKYFDFFDQFLNHFCCLVFGVGLLLIYLDWKTVNQFGWVSFLLP
ncbi:uncharacterized protein MELLADRAFT_114977 [Melampsora larici-populina 98AG31]|uniref:Golgi to ER traffic protein 2 n=1 Tax=Melampsora larici-populina (strain 98AG31 / pathotype 3-4-7) TaxID=747676 RepID=F4R4X4_MELLP|nr:uncharacterized protein MELLADRAFT_114977 [Melampsora larici-populina 98AG31]EGG12920.1 hypothetical protein MELLADRAFT_114977 [Melampsora larici-populina 98AG31]